MQVFRSNQRRLTLLVGGLTLCASLLGACGDDDSQPVSSSIPEGGTTIDGGVTTVEAISLVTSLADAGGVTAPPAADRSEDSSLDAALVDISANDASASDPTFVGSGDAEAGAQTRVESRGPAASTASTLTETAPREATSSETDAPAITEREAGASSHPKVDAGPFEPDATIVQTSNDFAGSAQGGGADNIDDAVITVALDGPIHSLLLAETDDAWAINGDAFWWSRPGDAIPVATPVLGGLTTEWNLFVSVGGNVHMTGRTMTALAAGTHELEIYLSWPGGSQPKYYVLFAFDEEGNVVSTSHLVY